MFVRVDGTYSRDDLGRVLSMVWSAMPDNIAKVSSLELSFSAFDLDERETYVSHIEGRPPGIVLTLEMGKSPDQDVGSTRWVYPGVAGWCSEGG